MQLPTAVLLKQQRPKDDSNLRVTDFVRAAVARGQRSKNRLSDETWQAFAGYTGPEVLGAPSGEVGDED